MNEIIKNIIEKISINIVLGVSWIFSFVITFLPRTLISYMDLVPFKDKYQFIFSLILIIVTSYFIIIGLKKVVSKIYSTVKINRSFSKLSKQFYNLTKSEQITLLHFFDIETNSFGLNAELDYSESATNVLVTKDIISLGSQLSHGGTIFSYFIQPYALEKLNSMVANDEIKVQVSTPDQLGMQQSHISSFNWKTNNKN